MWLELSELERIKKEVFDFINENDIKHYCTLVEYARNEKNDDWLLVITTISRRRICNYIEKRNYRATGESFY
jgi:hypothetical protein